MIRRRSTFSIINWFWKNIPVIFGFNLKSRRYRKVVNKKRKENINLSTFNNNNNNNRSLEINMNKLSDINQQQILCILMEKQKIVEYLTRYASNSQIIDLQDLVQLIQSTNITYEDASTMTNTNQLLEQTRTCRDFSRQSKNIRRLKALEFIRIFIENNREDFFKYLIDKEQLCEEKTLAIYQIIEQFLQTIYQSKYTYTETE